MTFTVYDNILVQYKLKQDISADRTWIWDPLCTLVSYRLATALLKTEDYKRMCRPSQISPTGSATQRTPQ